MKVENISLREIPVTGMTGVILAEECVHVLEDFNNVDIFKAILMDNTSTNTGCKSNLVTALEKKLENYKQLVVHYIRMTTHSEQFSNILTVQQKIQLLLQDHKGNCVKMIMKICSR